MSQTVDVAELAFAIENFLRPFAGDAQAFGECAKEFDDLRDVVVVFAVFRAGLGVEEVVARDEFEYLRISLSGSALSLSTFKVYGYPHHTRHTPHIGTRAPFGAQNDLG